MTLNKVTVHSDDGELLFSDDFPHNVNYNNQTQSLTFDYLKIDENDLLHYLSCAYSNVTLQSFSDTEISFSSIVIHSGTGIGPKTINIKFYLD